MSEPRCGERCSEPIPCIVTQNKCTFQMLHCSQSRWVTLAINLAEFPVSLTKYFTNDLTMALKCPTTGASWHIDWTPDHSWSLLICVINWSLCNTLSTSIKGVNSCYYRATILQACLHMYKQHDSEMYSVQGPSSWTISPLNWCFKLFILSSIYTI